MVGLAGFEPAVSCSQSTHHTKLDYNPAEISDLHPQFNLHNMMILNNVQKEKNRCN